MTGTISVPSHKRIHSFFCRRNNKRELPWRRASSQVVRLGFVRSRSSGERHLTLCIRSGGWMTRQGAVVTALSGDPAGIRLGGYRRRQHLVGNELAATSSVSRTPVREALRRLPPTGIEPADAGRDRRDRRRAAWPCGAPRGELRFGPLRVMRSCSQSSSGRPETGVLRRWWRACQRRAIHR